MTYQEYERLLKLRKALHDEIHACLKIDGHCKSYEGLFQIGLPCAFEGDPWRIELHCYVVGPSRHYSWEGDTFVSALEKCEVDVYEWINESAKWRAEYKSGEAGK